MITIAFIIIYPIVTLIVGYLIGSWKTEEKKSEEPKLNPRPLMDVAGSTSVTRGEIPKKKHEAGLVRRPTAEDLERKANPKLAESDEAWDTDMEKLFGSPYKLAIQSK